ncbi:MAG: VOC family protein [Actinomycetota bacterium]
MKPHVSVITLGVRDMARAKNFYAGLGWPIEQDYEQWVTFPLGDGSTLLGLYPWDALADDAGVAPDGEGFRGMTLSYVVSSEDRVAEVIAEAEGAGADVVKPAEKSQWGGAFGYFADPDGYLWKVASAAAGNPSYVAE